MDDRKLREKDFHDMRFSNDGGQRNSVEKYYKSVASAGEKYYEAIFSGLNGKKVLEYGCGAGNFTINLVRAGAQVTGIDISERGIVVARDRAKNMGYDDRVQYCVMDAENTDFLDNTFDLIVGSGILHHLSIEQSINEIKRVMVKDGKAVFFEPMGHNPFINLYRKLTPGLRSEDEKPLLSKDLDFIKSAFPASNFYYYGFSSIASSFISDYFFYPKVNSLLSLFDQYLVDTFPYLSKYYWVVVMELRSVY